MSTTAAPATVRPSFRHATFSDAVLSEWTKFRTVRSSFWSLTVAAVLGIGLGALISAISANHYATDPGVQLGWNATDRSLGSLRIAELVFAILGVMVVTGEYSTGMIRTSLTAVPRRSRMLSAKTLVFGVVAVIAGEIISFITFAVGQAVINGKAPSASLGQHEVLRAVVGGGLYLTLIALMGLALGVILRHAAAAIGTAVAILLVLPGITAALPTSWAQPIEKYWPAGAAPTNAGRQIMLVSRDAHSLTPWLGLSVFIGFVAVLLVVAFTLLEKRDA